MPPDQQTKILLFNNPFSYNPNHDDRGRLTPIQAPKAQSSFLQGGPFEVRPLYEDRHNQLWLSGTASYLLQGDKNSRYVLKIPDLSHASTYKEAKENLETANARIDEEINTLCRLHELQPNQVTKLVQPPPKSEWEIQGQETRWINLFWPGQSEPLPVRCFVREFVPGFTLREWCRHWVAAEDEAAKKFSGLQEVRDWFSVAAAIAESLRSIHRGRIVHGYISPDNIIVRIEDESTLEITSEQVRRVGLPGAQDIFFANTEQFSLPPTGAGGDNMLRRLYDAPEKWRPSVESEWYSPTDVFSLGMVLLFLAIGDDIEILACKELSVFDKMDKDHQSTGWYQIEKYAKYRMRHELARQLLNAIRQHSFSLDHEALDDDRRRLEIAIRISCVIMDCIEPEIQYRAPTLRGVLRQMRFFAPVFPVQALAENEQLEAATSATIERLQEIWKTGDLLKRLQHAKARFLSPAACADLPPSLAAVVTTRLSLLLSDLDDVGKLRIAEDKSGQQQRSLRITAGREHLVETMLVTLSRLERGDECEALLTPTFWFDENMGEFGRVLRMLELAVLAGAKLKWILIVNPARLQQPRVREVLRYQGELSKEMEKAMPELIDDPPLQYTVLHDELFYRISREQLTHIRLPDTKNKRPLTIALNYAGDGQKLNTLRLWVNSRRDDVYKLIFEQVSNTARPLANYNR